jgi:hypothetical protein
MAHMGPLLDIKEKSSRGLEQDRNNNGTYAVIIWLLIGAATLKL